MSSADVLVYGASAAGVLAAAAAAEEGASVTLVGPEHHLGGMVAGGLGWTDVGSADVISGLTRRFYALVAARYDTALFAIGGPEPHVAEEIFRRLAERSGASVHLGAPLRTLERTGAHLVALEAGRDRHEAAVFIDASYEGDLLAAAGVPHRVGREARALHGERWAGRQPVYRPGMHNFSTIVSPFVSGDDGELVAGVAAPELDARGWPAEHLGAGDGALQGYQLRLCFTDDPANQLAYTPPADYDPARFELLRRYCLALGERLGLNRVLCLVPGIVPRAKCDVNSVGPFSLNLLDGTNRDYVAADAAGRAAIAERHRRHSHELCHFLRSDPAVPAHIRAEVRRWWLCADEFTETGGWPHQLYVREARRLVGRRVLTEHDLLDPAPAPDAIATGSYNIDLREMERTWRYLPEYHRTPAVFNDGYLSVAVPPFPIPYDVLLPDEQDADNLLVPVCCSASQVAYGSLRTEPTLMALGEAAGRAGALSAISGRLPAAIDLPRLQAALAAAAAPT